MLSFYDKNSVKYPLIDRVTNYYIIHEQDGNDTLSFCINQNDEMYKLITNECKVETDDNIYLVKKIDEEKIECSLDFDFLKTTLKMSFKSETKTLAQLLSSCLPSTWTVINGNCTTIRRTIALDYCTNYDIILQAMDTYGVFFVWNMKTKTLTCVNTSLVKPQGEYLTDELNLKKVTYKSSTSGYVTRLYGYGKDGLSFASINGGKAYLDNFTYSNKIVCGIWQDNRYTVKENLIHATQLKLNELSVPATTYKCNVIDLAKLSDDYSFLDFEVHKSVILIDRVHNLRVIHNIVEYKEYPNEPDRNVITLSAVSGNVNSKISSMASDINSCKSDVNTLYKEKVSADYISALEADFEVLYAKKQYVDDAVILKADISDLTVASGNIALLQSDMANITTILSGSIGTGTLQTLHLTAVNSTVDKLFVTSQIANQITVADLVAGDISTNRFRIVSDSGKLLISDNTIQIKDNNRVRVQIGKDSNADYNMYVWDTAGKLMFDATGLHADGIKSGIIRNDMVSDNANINGSKIDITSLITAVNGSTSTIKASKVKLDTSSQTLDVDFSSLQSTITTQGNSITSQSTAISVLQGQITSKVEQSDIDTAVNSIQVGGRNLLRNTQTFDGYSKSAGVTISADVDGCAVVTYPAQATLSYQYLNMYPPIPFSTIRGKEVTFSCYMRSDDYDKFNSSTSRPLICFALCTANSTVRTKYKSKGLENKLTSSGWNKVEFTVTATDDYFSSGSGTIDDSTRFYIIAYDYSLYSLQIKKPKLELGNKATDYTPATEDLATQTELSAKYAEIQQSIDGINLTVSSVQTSVTTANSTANSAKTSADNAISSANTAVSTANSAKTTATTANSNASTALSTANTANTNASNAVSTANTAKSTADDTASNLATNYSTTTQMTSAIQLATDSINLSVSKTYATQATVDSIQIGGRNLVLNSSIEKSITKTADSAVVIGTRYVLSDYGISNLISDTTITISVEAKATLNSVRINPYISNAAWNVTCGQGKALQTITTEWARYSWTFQITQENAARIQITANTLAGSSGVTYYIRNIKCEIGNKATDYSQATEDVDNKFLDYSTTAEMQSAIQLATDSINLSVSQTYATQEYVTLATSGIAINADNIALCVKQNGIISAINQTAENITINASKINLKGNVVANNNILFNTNGDLVCGDINGRNTSSYYKLSSGAMEFYARNGKKHSDYSYDMELAGTICTSNLNFTDTITLNLFTIMTDFGNYSDVGAWGGISFGGGSLGSYGYLIATGIGTKTALGAVHNWNYSAKFHSSLDVDGKLSANGGLSVIGTGSFTGAVTVSAGDVSIKKGYLDIANNYGITCGGNISFRWKNNDALYVGIDSAPLKLVGTSITSNGASVTSDARKKHDIHDVDSRYTMLLDKLNAKLYHYNDYKQNVTNVGFIAQEVLSALDECGLTADEFGGFVDVYGDGREFALDYTQFIPILWQVIAQMKSEINISKGSISND